MSRRSSIRFGAVATRDLLLCAIFALQVLAPGAHAADWYDVDWDYRQKITILSSLTDSTLSSFPYLVKITDAANLVFDNAQSDGDDILFTGSDGTTKYDHEIEYYDSTSEELFAWVRIPSVSSSVDTEIYMYYGNAVVGPQETPANVWDTDYKAVWHLHDDFVDSTNNRNGTNNGTTNLTGAIADAQDFNGVDQWIGLGVGCFVTSAWTAETWIRPSASAANYGRLFFQGVGACGSRQLTLYWHSSHVEIVAQTDGTVIDPVGASLTIPTDEWSHVAWTFDGTTHTIYVDGASSSGSTDGAGVAVDGDAYIGRRLAGSYWKGGTDEVRISAVSRSADWVSASFRNQDQPGTYQTIDGQEPDTGPPADITDLATGTVTGTSIELTWTAPGDDGSAGTATTYDVRYRTDGAITSGNWDSATQVTGEPSPSGAGTGESFNVTGLMAGTTYYFAIKTADEIPSWSGLSNSANATTNVDGTAPAAITDLAATGTPTWFTISLTWTAPGDDGSTGTATSYDVRYSTSTITEGNWASATQASGEPAPQVAGSTEFFTVTGLSPNTLYYFAVKTSDEVPNTGSLSNVTNNTTANSGGSSAEFHPSGAATDDEMDQYVGGTAATALDTNDGDTSYGKARANLNEEGRLELDDSTQSGTIVSVQIKAYVRDNNDRSDDQMRLGLRTHATEYWGSIIDNVDASHTLYSGTSHTTNPNTGSAWTWTEIDDLVALVDNYNAAVEYRITEMYAEVVYEVGDATAPAAVSDLATGTVTSSSVALSWTAPGDDGSSGTASVYDIRYSTSTITAGNWSSAMQVTGEPTPSVAGSSESFSVSGLDPSTTYYFAIKTRDEVPNISGLSNVPSVATSEGVAPANVADLATASATDYSIELSWTAPGDDGATGTATTYDIRYRTGGPVTAGNWDTATQATGEPSPSVAGTSESFTVTGLTANSTYYFAIKTADEVPNWSGLSNSPSGLTTADTTAPADITDLATGTALDTSIELSWTAPGDSGSYGTATTYDIRYRTGGAVTSGNWDSATQATGEPSPSVAGTAESFTVTGLTPATTYYFAIKAADEVPNESGVSNSPSEMTDGTAPAAITDLATTGTPTWFTISLTWTAPGDDGSTGTATSYDIRYSTSTITEGNWASATQASGEPAPQVAGSTEFFTVTGLSQNTQYYFAIKTSDEVPNTGSLSNVTNNTTANSGGLTAEFHPSGAAPGDEMDNYVGGTADIALDTNDGDTSYGKARANLDEEGRLELDDSTQSGSIVSVQIKAYVRDNNDNSDDQMRLGLRTHATEYWGSIIDNVDASHTLYSGTSHTTNPNTGSAWTWAEIDDLAALVDNYNARSEYRVTELYAEVIYEVGDSTAPAAVSDLTTGAVTSSSVALSWTAPGDDGSSGTASVYDIRYSTSTITAGNWSSAMQVTAEPTPSVAGSSESFSVTGLDPSTTYYFAIKTRDEVPNISGLSNVPSATTAEGVAPEDITDLATGTVTENSVELTWTAPGDDGATGTATTYDIRYRTGGPITAGNWDTATQVTGEPSPSVAGSSESFTVNGLTAGVTYYFAIKTADEVPNWSGLSNSPGVTAVADTTAPENITDLGTGTVEDLSVELTWTAPGDDGATGTATTYDIRYRTDAAITSGNWDSAIQVTGEPSPSVAGTSESFTVTGLTAGTTYYFAIKAADEVPNWSGLSNSPSATTDASDTTAPAAIPDLSTTGTPTQSAIALTWTAPGDDGSTGTATSYDIRYSTSTITEGNWASATQASGEPAPQVAGSTEFFTVTGLSQNTQYYFAIKTSDEVPNTGSLSNVTNNTTANSGGLTAEFHPSGAAPGDEMDNYVGGTADIALDTNDGDTSYGKARANLDEEGRLELDDSTQSGSIVSVQIKAYVRDNNDNSDDQMRLGLRTHATEYWGSIIDNVDASHTLYSGTSHTTNPNTGSAWTWAEIDDLAALVDNYNARSEYRVTELYAEVIYEVGDSTAPAAVSDLTTGAVTSSSVALSWTAPGDDGSSGTASVYDIRYSTSTITAGNWSSAMQVTGEPTPSVAGSSESLTVTGLTVGTTYYFAIKTRDEVPNISGLSNVPSAVTHTPPVGGYTVDDVIPADQISQSTDGQGTLTINWKGRDDETDNVTLNTFEYSVDGGSTWNAPDNADLSAALSTDWDDNGGSGWTTASTFASATAHSFTFDTQHADLSGLDGVDQSDARVRVRLNDGTANSDSFVISESVRVDNEAPTDTIVSVGYSPTADTMTITGTDFLTVAAATTDVRTYVDWTKFVWDVNGDDATTADITFVVGDVTSLTVTDDTTLTLVFTAAKATAIEATTGYGSAGGADTLDVTAGFSADDFGNAATTDGSSDAPLAIVAPQLTIVKSSSVISDPINGGTDPRRIPEAVVEYSVIVTNNGAGSPDDDSVVLTDPIDSGKLVFDVDTGVTFTDGATSSGLSLGTVVYSSTAAPGPYVYDYSPGPGYDGNVTSVKIPTIGTLANGGAPAPSFTVKFRVKVK